MWTKGVCLAAFIAVAGVVPTWAADAPAELPLPTQLRELDRDYANGLEAILTQATVQDDKALIEDIQARLTVVKQYRTVAPKREPKSLLIVATLGEQAELHLSRRGVEWHRVKPRLTDITYNGIAYEPVWENESDWTAGTLLSPPAMVSMVSYESRGPVTVTKIDRGPGKFCLCIKRTTKTKGSEPVTFKLLIKYLPPLTAEGQGAK